MPHRQREASQQDSAMGPQACIGFIHPNPSVVKESTNNGRDVVKEMDLPETEEASTGILDSLDKGGCVVPRERRAACRKELKLLLAKLKECELQISFCAEVADTCHLSKIFHSGCQVLHCTDHANGKGLAFESGKETECGVAEALEVASLKIMFEAGQEEREKVTKLVFIGSCCSEENGNAFVEAGVPHVVAVTKGQSVSDQAAVQFADLFYDALINNSGMFTVREAFETALKAVDPSHLNEPKEKRDYFLLLPKDGNHDVRMFDLMPEGGFIDRTRYPPQTPPYERAVSKCRGLVGLEQRLAPTLLDNHGDGELKAMTTRVESERATPCAQRKHPPQPSQWRQQTHTHGRQKQNDQGPIRGGSCPMNDGPLARATTGGTQGAHGGLRQRSAAKAARCIAALVLTAVAPAAASLVHSELQGQSPPGPAWLRMQEVSEELFELGAADAFSLALPGLVGALLTLVKRVSNKVRYFGHTRHHAVACLLGVWWITVVIVTGLFHDAPMGAEAKKWNVTLPVMAVGYMAYGIMDAVVIGGLIVINYLRRLCRQGAESTIMGARWFQSPVAARGSGSQYSALGQGEMPGLWGWYFTQQQARWKEQVVNALAAAATLGIAAATGWALAREEIYVPVFAMVLTVVLTLTGTHPTLSVVSTRFEGDKDNFLAHAMTAGSLTAAAYCRRDGSSLRITDIGDMQSSNGAVSGLTSDPDSDYAYAKVVTRGTLLEHGRSSLAKALIHTTSRLDALVEKVTAMASQKGALQRDSIEGILFMANGTELLHELYSHGSARHGTESERMDYGWFKVDGKLQLRWLYVQMFLHRRARRYVGSVARRGQGGWDAPWKADNTLPYWFVAAEERYGEANVATTEGEQDLNSSRWRLQDAKARGPDLRRDLAVLGVDITDILSPHITTDQASTLEDAYGQGAKGAKDLWTRVYALMLVLVEAGDVRFCRDRLTPSGQGLRSLIENPLRQNEHLQSILASQVAYAVVVGVRALITVE